MRWEPSMISNPYLIGLIASLLCLIMDIVIVSLSKRLEVKMEKFERLCKLPIIVESVHLAGFRYYVVERELVPGLSYYDLIPIFFILLALTTLSRFRKEEQGNARIRLSALGESTTRDAFLMLVVIQSALPVLVLFVPLLAALGRFSDPGIIPIAGLLYLFGPGSLYFCIHLGRGSPVQVKSLSLSPKMLALLAGTITIGLTMFGIHSGISLGPMLLSDKVLRIKYQTCTSIMVLVIAYLIGEKGKKPATHFTYILLGVSALMIVSSMPYETLASANSSVEFLWVAGYVISLLGFSYLLYLMPRIWDAISAKLPEK